MLPFEDAQHSSSLASIGSYESSLAEGSPIKASRSDPIGQFEPQHKAARVDGMETETFGQAIPNSKRQDQREISSPQPSRVNKFSNASEDSYRTDSVSQTRLVTLSSIWESKVIPTFLNTLAPLLGKDFSIALVTEAYREPSSRPRIEIQSPVAPSWAAR